jgi:hypothetical protein
VGHEDAGADAMKTLIAFCLGVWPCLSAINNFAVLGTTATQAIIGYDAPNASPCTVQVSQSSSLTPAAFDVDPNTFANSNSDLSRPSTIVNGSRRTLVIGQRTAQLATAGAYAVAGTPGAVGYFPGRHFSRALQAFTPYYGLITCSSTGDTQPFTFTTTNIPLGMTYGDPWLSDPSNPGVMPWPESVGASTTDSFIDPLTGTLLQRVGLRSNNYRIWNSALGPLPTFGTAYNQGQTSPCDSAGPWTNPCGTIVIGGSGSTTVANSQAPLVLRPPLNTPGSPWPWNSGYVGNSYNQFWTLDQLSVTLTGSISSSNTANRVLDVCLSMNGGASCASSTQQMTLGQTSGSQTVGQENGAQFGVLPWLLDTNPRINAQESSSNSGTDSVNGSTVTWLSGSNYWSLYWVNGGAGHIRLSTASTADACALAGTSSADYKITGFIDGTHITVSPTPPAGANWWCALNFTVMVWRDAVPDGSTVTLTGASMAVLESFQDPYPDNGGGSACLNTPVQGGFFCLFGGLYWINPTIGSTVYYGYMESLNPGIANTWNSIGTLPAGETSNIDQSQSALTFYFVSGDPGGGGPLVIQGVFNPPSITQPAPYPNGNQIGNAGVSSKTAYSISYNNGLTFTNLTPQNAGATCETVVCQMINFDPSWNAGNNTVKFGTGINGWNCIPYGESLSVFFFTCYADNEDSPAWIFAFSPGTGDNYGNPAMAGQPGGPQIIGAINTFNTPNGPVAPTQTALTGRGLHAVVETGDTGWINVNTHTVQPINTTQTAIPSTSPTTCAALGVAGNNNQCIQLQIVDHTSGAPCTSACTGYEPYFATPQFQFTGAPGEMRTTQPGDTACVILGSSSGCSWQNQTNELMTLVQKNTNGAWIFQRNGYGAEKAVTCSTLTPCSLFWQSIQWILPVGNYTSPNAMSVYWSPTTGCNGSPDPHGNCLMQDTNELIEHGEWRDGGEAVACNVPLWNIPEFNSWPTDYQTMVGSVPAILQFPFANITPFQGSGVNYVSYSPPFAGTWGHPWSNEAGTHPNPAGATAAANESIRAFDNIPVQGNAYSPPFSNVTGQLYVATPTQVVDPDDPFGTAPIITINRKLMAQGNSCGSHPLIDISGPSSSVSTGTTGSYTVCYARNANECRSGSTVGQVYVNCPGVVWTYCSGTSIHGGTPLGVGNDICVGNQGAAVDAVRQFSLDQTDKYGVFTRTLVTATSWLRMVTGFENNRLLPDNSWLLFRMEFPEYQSEQMWMAKMPPWPDQDDVNRSAFVPMQVEIKPLPGLEVNNAVVQFGYQEYGAPGSLNCTARNDACLATGITIPAGNSPFYFASENPSGLSCAIGCTITIPALAQRVLYYRVVYRSASNAVVATSELAATMVP